MTLPSAEANKEITTTNIGLRPQNYKELRHLSDMIFKSSLCPKGVKDRDELFLRMHYGLDVGLSPLQAAANVCVINGKAALYGDAMLAVVQASPKYEWHRIEELSSSDKDDWGYKCTVKRKNMDAVSVTFTKKDAIKANLWEKKDQYGKPGPWCLYPQRMLKFKAIGFALRDVFADVLQGLIPYEEAIDYDSQQISSMVIEDIDSSAVDQKQNHPQTIVEESELILHDDDGVVLNEDIEDMR